MSAWDAHAFEEVNLVRIDGKWQLLNAPNATFISLDSITDPQVPVRQEGQTVAVGASNRVLVYAVHSVDLRRRVARCHLLYELAQED